MLHSLQEHNYDENMLPEKVCYFVPDGNDLTWDDHFTVLCWWGETDPGNRLPESNVLVNHDQFGWVSLSNFYFWAKTAIWCEEESVTIDHWHQFWPRALNPAQKIKIQNWERTRAQRPDFGETSDSPPF